MASGAAQLGANVVLVEGDRMGGDCLNYGCVPSKALLAAANTAKQVNQSDKFGIKAEIVNLDYAEVMAYVEKKIAEIAPHDSQERFEEMGVTVLRDYAKFKDPKILFFYYVFYFVLCFYYFFTIFNYVCTILYYVLANGLEKG